MPFNIKRNSVRSTASPSAGGTQSNELQAAIKSVTSSTTIGAVFLYDTKNTDSDGGAWRKKCKGLSWFDEASSATRSARSEFPAMSLIVADNASTQTVTIYDLDDVSAPMWMVFEPSATDMIRRYSTNNITSLAMLNGVLCTGFDGNGYGLNVINFALESGVNHDPSASEATRYKGNISERNAGNGVYADASVKAIVASTVNDVAMTVLEGAEIGALGLPIPTVAVATNGGLSVIHGGSGAVYDKATTAAAATLVEFDKGGNLFAGQDDYITRFDLSTLFADASNSYLSQYDNGGTLQTIRESGGGGVPVLLGTATNNDSLTVMGSDFACGGGLGLTLAKFNGGNHEESAVAYITSAYNTGYMVGDIRFAGLTNNRASDRSVKANNLTVNEASSGDTVDEDPVATGAEAKAFSNFSSTNYLSRASDTDFDFGTGDFSVMFWVKDSSVNSSQNHVSRSDATAEAGDWLIQSQASGEVQFYRHSGSSWALGSRTTASNAIVANQWTQVALVKSSSKIYWYINGKLNGTPQADSNTYTPSGGSALTVGHSLGEVNNFADNSSLSLLRISATAPTPQQIKEIYYAEKPLFSANSLCLLQAAGGYNDVKTLAYDKSTGLLTAGQTSDNTAGSTIFRGLEAIDTFTGYPDYGWSAGTTNLVSAAGGVSAYYKTGGTGGVVIDLPSVDVRAALQEGEDKLPDDGKLHFSGVTTDATVTTIASIPIAENEVYTVRAKVTSQTYGDADAAGWNTTEILRVHYRDFGANVGGRAVSSKLEDMATSTMDVNLTQDTSSQTVSLTVTGVAATRIVWTAEVEVQRISEKQYER